MTRLLELLVALAMVAIAALIVGLLLPSSGHIERSTVVSTDIRKVYDVFNNYRHFPEYSMLASYDPSMEYHQGNGTWYGPGASISWTSDVDKVGDGKLTIESARPGFDKIGLTGKGTIVWSIDNNWAGTNKVFTINIKRTGRSQRLTKITWGYDVDYGWSLINRYSGLYINGRPDALIQYSLGNLENLLASIPNISYDGLYPRIVTRKPQPVLLLSTKAKRNLTEVDTASAAAVKQIRAAMEKLGLHQVGPRIRFTTNYGNKKYTFDVAIPVSSKTVTIDGKEYTLQPPHAPKKDQAKASDDSKTADAASVATAASTDAPASASSAADAADVPVGPQPGDRDDRGRLIINHNVRAMIAFGGKALQAVTYGSPAGVPPTRLRLKAYAQAHGYPYNADKNRLYDVQVKGYGDLGKNGKPLAYDQQFFKVILPLKAAPEETPAQAAGLRTKTPFTQPAGAASAPARAGSVAPAKAGSTAPAEAGSTGDAANDGQAEKSGSDQKDKKAA